MSEENIEMVRRSYEHFANTGEPLGEVFAPDFVLDLSTFRGWPEQGEYEGAGGFRQFLDTWVGTWDEWEMRVDDLLESPDGTVLALLFQRGKAKGSGVPVEMEFAHVWRLDSGRVTRLEIWADRDEAREAAGLSKESA